MPLNGYSSLCEERQRIIVSRDRLPPERREYLCEAISARTGCRFCIASGSSRRHNSQERLDSPPRFDADPAGHPGDPFQV